MHWIIQPNDYLPPPLLQRKQHSHSGKYSTLPCGSLQDHQTTLLQHLQLSKAQHDPFIGLRQVTKVNGGNPVIRSAI